MFWIVGPSLPSEYTYSRKIIFPPLTATSLNKRFEELAESPEPQCDPPKAKVFTPPGCFFLCAAFVTTWSFLPSPVPLAGGSQLWQRAVQGSQPFHRQGRSCKA